MQLRALHNGIYLEYIWNILEYIGISDHVGVYRFFPKGGVPLGIAWSTICQTMLISGNPQLTDAFYEPPASQLIHGCSRMFKD
jgi:hypothetical protein